MVTDMTDPWMMTDPQMVLHFHHHCHPALQKMYHTTLCTDQEMTASYQLLCAVHKMIHKIIPPLTETLI